MVLIEADNYHTWGDRKMYILAYASIVTVGGLVENLSVIFLFANFKSLRTVTNNFIINLAVCNFLLSLMDLVFSLSSLFASDWLFGDSLAIVYAFSYFILVSVSMVMLAVIAIDRYHVISRPKLPVRLTTTKSIIVILAVYIYTLTIASPILYAPAGLEVRMYISGCYVDFAPSSKYGSGTYAIVITALLYLIPLTTMVHYYWKIYKVLRDRRKSLASGRRGDTPHKKHSCTPKQIQSTSLRPVSTYTMRNTPVKTLRVIAALIIFFILTWTPYQIVSLARAFHGRILFNDEAKEIAVLLTKSIVIINPIAYALVNHRFQKCIAKLLCPSQVILGPTTCTDNSTDFPLNRNGRGSVKESRRNSRGSTQERKPRHPSRVSRLPSIPEVFASESFMPKRHSNLRKTYSDSQINKHARMEESKNERNGERLCRRNTDLDRFLKLSMKTSQKTRNWDVYVTSF